MDEISPKFLRMFPSLFELFLISFCLIQLGFRELLKVSYDFRLLFLGHFYRSVPEPVFQNYRLWANLRFARILWERRFLVTLVFQLISNMTFEFFVRLFTFFSPLPLFLFSPSSSFPITTASRPGIKGRPSPSLFSLSRFHYHLLSVGTIEEVKLHPPATFSFTFSMHNRKPKIAVFSYKNVNIKALPLIRIPVIVELNRSLTILGLKMQL